ncbi:MAG TPA: multicopper oxidase domain-containing protein [Edaphobacter sp.]|nr:multicopper oxidase domain-containing protein [Edaphobacter sp.]
MPSSRRTFLHQASAISLLYAAQRALPQEPMGMAGMHDPAQKPNPPRIGPPMLHTLQLEPFVDPLPIPKTVRSTFQNAQRSLTVSMQEVRAKVHRDVPATRWWSYGPAPLAPVIEARSGEPIQIRWINNLPTKHFLPIDHSLHGCGHDVPDVRTATHLHGAKTASKDDGYPEDWFVPGQSRVCTYPLQQDATALWYHDHAMGLTRLNTYAGLFGMFLLRDQVEDALHLPSGKYEVPLIFCDRDFSTDGQIYYEVSGDPESPWVPEFSADGILVNGKIRPYFEVEPRLYRFRLLNTANSRFFLLSLVSPGADQLGTPHPLVQIGSDQGLLGTRVEVQRLVLGCAERADILVDFSQFAGQNIHLRTGAFDILEFRVGKQTAAPMTIASVPKVLRTIERIPESEAIKTRRLTLHDYQDDYERSMLMLINGKRWHEPVTETPKLNSTEIWEFINLTEDTHPMHLHLVRFQILDRRPFNVLQYFKTKQMLYQTQTQPPAPNEMGWKDTVQCPPGTVTRIIVKFEGFTGKYLYHCHILEHESNDMMRPFEVVA